MKYHSQAFESRKKREFYANTVNHAEFNELLKVSSVASTHSIVLDVNTLGSLSAYKHLENVLQNPTLTYVSFATALHLTLMLSWRNSDLISSIHCAIYLAYKRKHRTKNTFSHSNCFIIWQNNKWHFLFGFCSICFERNLHWNWHLTGCQLDWWKPIAIIAKVINVVHVSNDTLLIHWSESHWLIDFFSFISSPPSVRHRLCATFPTKTYLIVFIIPNAAH